jgi:uncharacterized membrane protein YbhN (UPF0104 family)
MPKWNDLIAQVKDLPESEKQGFSLHALKTMPIDVTTKALADFVASQPEENRQALSKRLAEAVTTAAPIGSPSQGKRDIIWLIVVSAFAFVLCGTFLTLAFGVFFPVNGKVTPELILAMFTSVVGFLAGLFVPSPGSSRGTQPR